MRRTSATHTSSVTASKNSALTLPAHIAIIMDGNGRWASQRGIPRKIGHKQGAETLRQLLEHCRELPFLTHLTVYAFSAENWKRSDDEIKDLMELLAHYLTRESKTLHKQGVRIRFIGDRSALSESIQASLSDVEKLTENNTVFTLVIALSYGSRQEVSRTVATISRRVSEGEIALQDINETLIAQTLDTAGIPDPDLLIRTGGDQRLSNFLLWQSAYTELYFTEVLWPDFTPDHLRQAVECFSQRERRFGARK
jgi:undecaprenyl diphosphate synthase